MNANLQMFGTRTQVLEVSDRHVSRGLDYTERVEGDHVVFTVSVGS
jgi:hypothetical protein